MVWIGRSTVARVPFLKCKSKGVRMQRAKAQGKAALGTVRFCNTVLIQGCTVEWEACRPRDASRRQEPRLTEESGMENC